MANKRHSEIQIIGEILDLPKNGAKKTEVLYQNNMSFSQLQDYLSYLLYLRNVQSQQTRPICNLQRGHLAYPPGYFVYTKEPLLSKQDFFKQDNVATAKMTFSP